MPSKTHTRATRSLASSSRSKRASSASGGRKTAAKSASRSSPETGRSSSSRKRIVEVHLDRRLEALPTATQKVIVDTVSRVGDSIVRAVDKTLPVDQLRIVKAAAESTAQLVTRALKTENVRKRVDATRIDAIEEAASNIISQLVHDSYSATLSNTQLGERAQLAVDAFRVALGGSRKQLQSLIDALDADEEPDADEDLERARAQARLRMQAVFQKIRRESLTVGELKPYKSRQRLQQLRDEGRLFAIKSPYERGLLYPSWQFDEGYEPRTAMSQVLNTAKESGLSALSLHQLMSRRRDSRPTGIELLDAGKVDQVLRLLSTSERGHLSGQTK